MSKMDEVRKAYEEAKRQHVREAADPSTPEAKKTARVAGALLLFVGLLLTGGVYVLFVTSSRISPLLTGAALGLTGIGLYLVVMGKMPSGRR